MYINSCWFANDIRDRIKMFEMLYKVAFLFSILFINVRPTGAFPLLPDNIGDGEELVRNGMFDSSMWERIKPYYLSPLRVAYGELSAIAFLFPEEKQFYFLGDVCKKYEPWSEFEISQFFQKYPELLTIRPILDFSYFPDLKLGHLVLSARKSSTIKSNLNSYLRCNEKLFASGRLSISENNMIWQKRCLQIAAGPGLLLEIGNFAGQFNNLIFGDFPEVNSSYDRVGTSNWIYGGRRDFNGVNVSYKMKSNRKKGTGATSFFVHKQEEECIFSALTTCNLFFDYKFDIGFSYLNSIVTQKKTGYIHVSAAFNSKQHHTYLSMSMDIKNAGCTPVYFSTDLFNKEKHGLDLTFVLYPRNSMFPYSSLYQTIKNDIDNDLELHALSKLSMTFTNRYEKFKIDPGLAVILESTDIHNILATIRTSGHMDYFNWNFGFSYYAIKSIKNRNSYILSIEWPFQSWIKPAVTQKWYADEFERWQLNNRLLFHFLLKKVFEVSPYVNIDYKKYNDELGIRGGLVQRLNLYEHSEMFLMIESPVTKNNDWKDVRFEIRTSIHM